MESVVVNPDNLAFAKELVVKHENKRNDQSAAHLKVEEVLLVDYSYILGGWKAHLATTRHDGMFYEVTCNPANQKAFVDSYKKWENSEYSFNPDLTGIVKE